MFIVYRAYAGETDKAGPLRPDWFNKFKCWASFWKEFSSCDVAVLWDGECSGDFYDYIKSTGVKVENHSQMGNRNSLLKTYELLKNSQDNIVGAVEDDYLFLPGCLDVLMEGFEIGFPMITLYEHPSRYLNPQEDHSYKKEEIYLGRNNYWRSVESTTGTCFFKKSIFDLLYQKLLHYNINDRMFFRDVLQNNIRLFSPMPGWATHVCIDRGINLMSPFTDWWLFNNSIVL